MLEFIRGELAESILYRNPHTVEGRTAKDLAITLYCAILGLEMLRHHKPDAAARYAGLTLQYSDFNNMVPTATDMSNIMTVLSNQDKYQDHLDANFDVSVPLLQARSYLRRVYNGAKTDSQDRQFFLGLQESLGVYAVDLAHARRIISWYSTATDAEKHQVQVTLTRYLSQRISRIDLFSQL